MLKALSMLESTCFITLDALYSLLHDYFTDIDMLFIYACNHRTLAFISIYMDMNANTFFSYTKWSYNIIGKVVVGIAMVISLPLRHVA